MLALITSGCVRRFKEGWVTQSMRQMRTVLRNVRPNHLGFALRTGGRRRRPRRRTSSGRPCESTWIGAGTPFYVVIFHRHQSHNISRLAFCMDQRHRRGTAGPCSLCHAEKCGLPLPNNGPSRLGQRWKRAPRAPKMALITSGCVQICTVLQRVGPDHLGLCSNMYCPPTCRP